MINKKTKTVLKEIGLILGVSIMLGLLFSLISNSDKVSNGALTKIDSLHKVNDSLVIAKDSLDSVRTIHLKQIDSLTMVVDTIESKVKIVRVYYNKKASEVAKYTPGELDTFFKIRYNY